MKRMLLWCTLSLIGSPLLADGMKVLNPMEIFSNPLRAMDARLRAVGERINAFNDQGNQLYDTIKKNPNLVAAAIAPLLVSQSFMAPVGVAVSETLPHLPALAVRASATTICAMPLRNLVSFFIPAKWRGIVSSVDSRINYSVNSYLTQNGFIPPAASITSTEGLVGHYAASYAFSTATAALTTAFVKNLSPKAKGVLGAIFCVVPHIPC